MSRKPLSTSEVEQFLVDLPEWEIKEGKLSRSFKFPDFVGAIGWMVSVAFEAERLDHHPNWSNVWNKVDVVLWTHSAGAITELDIALARKMEMLSP